MPVTVTASIRFAAACLLVLSISRIGGAEAERISFYGQIKPILSVHCQKCHGSETQKSGLRLDLPSAALKGGESGAPAIVPGNAAKSEVIRRITSTDPDEKMPPKGHPLSEREISLIKTWIQQGAAWPERDDYWSFLPRKNQPIPTSHHRAQNPIDQFIHARLEPAALVPLPRAGDVTLLRRAFADLIGVPPTPLEADLFLGDRKPGAFERLIERLVNDPRYGERWARHWLDLARYGESDGYEDDKLRPHAWRYRDYVIRAFNTDKPYDRFVQEQIAGDLIWPADEDALIATGFARLGAWDGMSKEPARQRQDFLNDATDATASVFLGLTLGCAKCHDHKFDPISQKDYYAFQAFFSSVQRDTSELSGKTEEPQTVTWRYAAEAREAKVLRVKKDELLREAKAALEAQTSNATKINEAAISKKAEALKPGELGRINALLKEVQVALRLHEPKADVVRQNAKTSQTHILKAGDVAQPGPEVSPGFPEVLGACKPGASRRELANWLTAPGNPLVSRVFVNRVWLHHFGVGLVPTASDFGRNGRPASHPELLDWLANEFVTDGFSIKRLHRLIMTSEAYQRASGPSAQNSEKDSDNRLLWRMNRRRLEGEAIRDTILAVSGQLDCLMGGPGVYAKLPPNVTVELPNNDKELSWGIGSAQDNRRRSIYLTQRRSLTFPMLDVFDQAPMNQTCPVRSQTTVAPQALTLFNGEFSREAATHFARRLEREAGPDATRQINHAFRLAFARWPTAAELAESSDFLAKQKARRPPAGDAKAALVDFCHVLLNSNELIYPD